jgi:serine/threonine protein kinase
MFTVGHYRVCHLIGSGGGGRVYAGLDPVTGQQVALKICSKQLTDRQMERLRTEDNVMSNLAHRHIIKLHGVFENDSRLCIVMDYAEGGDLFEHIKAHKQLPRPEARRLFRQLVSALSYMHSQGYMHRDLKPENCLLDKDRNLLLADFGFSNFWSSYKLETEGASPTTTSKTKGVGWHCNHQTTNTQHSIGVGSLNYASPEIITSSATYVGPEVRTIKCFENPHILLFEKIGVLTLKHPRLICGLWALCSTRW